VPVLMLSMKSATTRPSTSAWARRWRPLRDEGVLILGSGLTYHNMRGFGRTSRARPAAAFEPILNEAIGRAGRGAPQGACSNLGSAPAARLAHPREDHLVPLFVVAGAAGEDAGGACSPITR
jgi:aromatic ring-opening dioxygenase catalytic subunit (LigB family)